MTSFNVNKLIPKDPKRIIVYLVVFCLIGYMACPLSVQLSPVDWWEQYDMIWYADDYSTDQYTQDADLHENVYRTSDGLMGAGPGQVYGKLIYTFTTKDWFIEKGRLGVIAESASQTCAIDVYIANQLAGSFNGAKEMLFCTADNLPSIDDPRQWILIPDDQSVQIKLIFFSNSTDGEKDLVLKQIEFSARVHPSTPSGEETGSLIGYVKDQITKSPIQGAKVVLSDKSTVTDQNGYYQISNIKPDTYTVRVTKSGYKDKETAITIVECQNDNGCNQYDCYLEPSGVASGLATLEGYIAHESGDPIEGANIGLNLGLVTHYQDFTDSDGYYKMENIEPGAYDFLALAKNCAPHHSWDMEISGEMRYDAVMGEGVSYPVPPGRGISAETEEYIYYPPVPPDYPTYVPQIVERAPSDYPTGGPNYGSTAPAPSDGADYVPPPPGYTNSGDIPGSGMNAPPGGGVEGAFGRALWGWNYLLRRGWEFFRGLIP